MLRTHSLLPRPIRSRLLERRLERARIIACDLDGTLLNGDVMIGSESARLIREIVALGVEFLFITARHHAAVVPFADELHLDQTIISLDGAMTSPPYATAPESTIALPQRVAAEVAEAAFATDGVDCAIVLGDRILLSDRDMLVPRRHMHWNIDLVERSAPHAGDEPVLELIVSGSFRGVNAVHDIAAPLERAGGIHRRLYESESHGDHWYLELRSEGACKLRALEAYVAARGIAMSEVVGIGDARNDLDFCEKSGYAVAVSNAVEPLRRMADFVTARGCVDEGINEFLEHFISARGASARRPSGHGVSAPSNH